MSLRMAVLLAGTALPVATAAEAQAAPANPAVATARELWQNLTDYITAAAVEMTEADYAYRPVGTVRTFGQLIGHVAGSQYLMCAAALGDPPRAEDEIEKSRTTKAGLLEALRASTEYCKKAYSQSDAAVQQRTQLFGQDRSRLYALGLNATHNGEHYGNIVTYMRMKGMVPPSSKPRP
jgi:uncharacterized damage-inducible protein DinB